MATVTLNQQINAPIDAVFARATDFANAASVIGGIQKVDMLTQGEVGPGTRFRETRVMFGREATEEMTVERFEPPNLYTLSAASHGSEYLTSFQLTERDGSTHVEMTFQATPKSLFAKLMNGLLGKMMVKTIVTECSKDLDDLRTAVERDH
ncbi:MAG: SRPBCC family protein [Acidobacteriota bacterium]